jgi:hypothetical protein
MTVALTNVEEIKTTLGIGDLYSDEMIQQLIDAVTDLIESYVTPESFEAEPPAMKEAAVSLVCDAFQARTAAGGQAVGVDYQTSPWRFGRSFMQKAYGLLAPYLDVESMIG